MSGQETTSLFDLQSQSELASSIIAVPEPAFDGKRFSLEVPSTQDQRLFINEFHRGVLAYGRSIGLNLVARLPRHSSYHFFPCRESMYRNLEVLGLSISGDEGGACISNGRGIVIPNETDKGVERSTTGHETTHFLHARGWQLAGSHVLTEAFVDLATSHFMQHWCSPMISNDFTPNYTGLGLVGDEIVRKAAMVLNIAPRRIFDGIMIDLVTGREKQVGKRIVERAIGKEALQWLIDNKPLIEYIDDVFDLADRLDLPDVYRRCTKVWSQHISNLVLPKWILTDTVPGLAQPLSTAERQDIEGCAEDFQADDDSTSLSVLDEIRRSTTGQEFGGGGQSVLTQIKEELQVATGSLETTTANQLMVARRAVESAIYSLHTTAVLCRTLVAESESELYTLECNLIDAKGINDAQRIAQLQAQQDSLKATIAKTNALAVMAGEAIDAAATDRERLEHVSAILQTAAELAKAYTDRL
jgi:hypothetical protein